MAPLSLRVIEKGAFSMCENLRYVELNEGLESLGENERPKSGDYPCGVFEGSGLEDIRLPSTIHVIESCAFRHCKRLKYIELHNKLEVIKELSFSDSGLENVTLPLSL